MMCLYRKLLHFSYTSTGVVQMRGSFRCRKRLRLDVSAAMTCSVGMLGAAATGASQHSLPLAGLQGVRWVEISTEFSPHDALKSIA